MYPSVTVSLQDREGLGMMSEASLREMMSKHDDIGLQTHEEIP